MPDREGQARLGVEVDEQDPTAELRQREPERVHRRRLGDAPLLVGYRHDARHGAESKAPRHHGHRASS